MLVTDPLDWALNDDGDVELPLRRLTGLEGVAQLVRFTCLLVRGEWFEDLTIGVPWLPHAGVPAVYVILGEKFSPLRVRETFRLEILKVPAVLEILQLEVEFARATRVLTVTVQVRTVFGDTEADTFSKEI